MHSHCDVAPLYNQAVGKSNALRRTSRFECPQGKAACWHLPIRGHAGYNSGTFDNVATNWFASITNMDNRDA